MTGVPEVVISPIFPPPFSVNQTTPLAATSPVELLLAVGVANSEIVPEVVIRPTLLLLVSPNHRLPSGPAVMPIGRAELVGMVNSFSVPEVVNRPILLPIYSVNHRLPSGPGG